MATTTLKAKMLGYRDVGSTSGTYTDVAGVLKGLTITQDEPESTSIDAEFSDSPFYIEYTGNPVTINFELANYTLSELTDLFGGTFSNNTYNAPTQITSTEKQWKLDFGVGFESLIIFKGQLVGTLKKDEDGALNYACSITSLMETYNDGGTTKYRTYAIVGPDQGGSGGGTSSQYGGAIIGLSQSLPHTFSGTSDTITVSLNQSQMIALSSFETDLPVGSVVGRAKINSNSYDLVVASISSSQVVLKDNQLNPYVQVVLAVSSNVLVGSLKLAGSSSSDVEIEYIYLADLIDLTE